MSYIHVKPNLLVNGYVIEYFGKPVYDFRRSIQLVFGNKETRFNNSENNWLNVGDHYMCLPYSTHSFSKTTYSDFYYYYLIDRIKTSGLSPIAIPELAEYFVQKMSKEIQVILERLVSLLLLKYDNVITDIPNIGGTCIAEIYSNPKFWYINYKQLVELNMFNYLKDTLNINLNKFRGRTIVLMLHNPELASDICDLIPSKNTIPIVLFKRH